MYVCTFMFAQMHMYIYTHVHTHTHTYVDIDIDSTFARCTGDNYKDVWTTKNYQTLLMFIYVFSF